MMLGTYLLGKPLIQRRFMQPFTTDSENGLNAKSSLNKNWEGRKFFPFLSMISTAQCHGHYAAGGEDLL
jgi:hypothetical protein